MYVMLVIDVKQTPNIECNRNQAHKYLQRHTICLTDSDHDFILDEIKYGENIEYERDMSVNDNKE